ncbi:TRAP transporter small permease [Chelativorans xinjiangense]|uniref:TRAP transporter small permease n=1 Tax=Chelativorans xinjiangense TaxID=2681485 RepID=UPI00135B7245|nr:TRAP transporter small permease [Chelativorans xinjiangense]
MALLERLLSGLTRFFAWVAVAATILMMLHVTADAIGRTFFSRPIVGTIEIVSAYYMAAIVFLPLALVTCERGHIIVDLFTGWMKLRSRTLLDGLVGIVTLTYTATFAWKAFEIAVSKTRIREAQEAGTGVIEIWPSRWTVVAGFALMAIYLAIYVVSDLRAGFTGRLDPRGGTGGFGSGNTREGGSEL